MSITITAAHEVNGWLETTSNPAVQVNMNGRNAAAVFDLLGLDNGDIGDTPAEDFLGRVLLAQALFAVTVDDEHGRPPIRDGRTTEGGRRPGYYADVLAELHKVATWAVEHDAVVVWS